MLEELVFEFVRHRQGLPQVLAGGGNGSTHRLDRAVANGGNFFRRETFDGKQQESFAILALGAEQRDLHQVHHLNRGGGSFGRGQSRVRNDVAGDDVLIRLVV